MNRTTVSRIGEVSTLVELLRGRALQHPEQRIFTYLVDGEIEGANLTFAALDWQARAIGALLQSYRASGERALLLYPAGLEFIPAFFGCLYAGVIAVPLPPPNTAQPHRTLPRLRAIADDAQPMLALTTSSILSKLERFVRASSRTTDNALVGNRQSYRQCGAGLAKPWGNQQHPGFAPVHFGLHCCAERRNGQSREPSRELGPHQPSLRDYAGHCIRDMATGFP